MGDRHLLRECLKSKKAITNWSKHLKDVHDKDTTTLYRHLEKGVRQKRREEKEFLKALYEEGA